MRTSVSLRELRATIDESKLGPNSPLRDILKKGQRAPSRDLEHKSQVALFDWAREQEARWPELERMFAVPNWFGVRTAKQGARAKAEGRKADVPDVWFPVRRATHPGLVIEMKVPGRKPTVGQNAWLAHLHRDGWKICVAYDEEQAITAVREYLELAT
jgi:hypothetical protein